ncbi:hypothetical protein LAZ67_13001808 [Cordylochernes scorpioides]|uniref:Uncharacterized protein n=1 Tax=Cordylochernes scorpioides TaxID=51811 RepID=A0ABY6L6T2_9ARAC|nr:hypothetical protein LAZ67_13001808 [Cordylochernes scorpioides]
MEERYQGVWDCHMMADYCRNLSRDLPEYTYKRKSKRERIFPQVIIDLSQMDVSRRYQKFQLLVNHHSFFRQNDKLRSNKDNKGVNKR